MDKANEAIKIGKNKKRLRILLFLLFFGGIGTAIALQLTGPYKGYMDPTLDKIFQSSQDFIAEVNSEDEEESPENEEGEGEGEEGEEGEGEEDEEGEEGKTPDDENSEDQNADGENTDDKEDNHLKFSNTSEAKDTNVSFDSGKPARNKDNEFFNIPVGPNSNKLTAYDVNENRGKSPKSLKTEVTLFARWINFQQKRMGGTLINKLWARPYDNATVMYMVMSSQYFTQKKDFKQQVAEMIHRQWIERIHDRRRAHIVMLNSSYQIVGGSQINNGSKIWVK